MSCERRLSEWRRSTAEEVFLVNILHNHAARRRSYELLAEAFGLLTL